MFYWPLRYGHFSTLNSDKKCTPNDCKQNNLQDQKDWNHRQEVLIFRQFDTQRSKNLLVLHLVDFGKHVCIKSLIRPPASYTPNRFNLWIEGCGLLDNLWDRDNLPTKEKIPVPCYFGDSTWMNTWMMYCYTHSHIHYICSQPHTYLWVQVISRGTVHVRLAHVGLNVRTFVHH